MALENDDIVITNNNSHYFYEHLAVDLISNYFLQTLSNPQYLPKIREKVEQGSNFQDIRRTTPIIKNTFFESLVTSLNQSGCLSQDAGDLPWVAIVPAFIHHNIMPQE